MDGVRAKIAHNAVRFATGIAWAREARTEVELTAAGIVYNEDTKLFEFRHTSTAAAPSADSRQLRSNALKASTKPTNGKQLDGWDPTQRWMTAKPLQQSRPPTKRRKQPNWKRGKRSVDPNPPRRQATINPNGGLEQPHLIPRSNRTRGRVAKFGDHMETAATHGTDSGLIPPGPHLTRGHRGTSQYATNPSPLET